MLSKTARKYCKEYLKEQGREPLVEQLEGIGVACYDDDDLDDLLDCAVDSVEAGDIEFDWSHAAAKSCNHRCYMLWLDIEEIHV